MPNVHELMFNTSATPLLDWQFGVDVVLSNQDGSSATFQAKRREREYEADGQDLGLELYVKVLMRDYELTATDCVIGGNTVEPKKGYRITEGSETFEVLPPNERTPAVELQTGGYEYTVHTKRVEVTS